MPHVWAYQSRPCCVSFFFQAEDGIRDLTVTGVQTCALPISVPIQLLCALGFAVLAFPALALGAHLLGQGEHEHPGSSGHSWTAFIGGPELPTWIASATNFLVTYGFGLALVTGFAFYQRLRDSQLRSAALERALTQAHLAALRMQLSPHTLFNLLHTIRGQISWDPPAAQAMVVQLGDLLRRLLSAGEREFSRLSDELQFVALYLELQQKRFADRLTITAPAPADIPRAWVPSLILQPLVEDRKSTRLNSSHSQISYAVFCLKKKTSICLTTFCLIGSTALSWIIVLCMLTAIMLFLTFVMSLYLLLRSLCMNWHNATNCSPNF